MAASSCAADDGRQVVISSVCLLDGEQYHSREYVLEMTAQACGRPGSDLVVVPFTPFLTFRQERAEGDLAPFAELASAHKTYIALALMQMAEGKLYATSVLLDRQGQVVATWRKTHGLSDDRFALGDELEVFRADFGVIGATIGTDFYFPEIYEVLRMKGAEVILWQHYPERFRDHSAWEPLLLARAFDSHVHLVAAHWSDPRAYITNRYSYGMQGAAWGRSMIVNRVGVPIADTGYEDGIATAVIDLDKRKQDPYEGWSKSENCFYVNVLADRKAFAPVAEPWSPPKLPTFTKRTARVVVIAMDSGSMWRNEELPHKLLELLDEAAELKPDIILASEQGASEDDPTTQKALEMVAERARKMGCYICIGGLRDKDFMSIARLWDRTGELVWQQPIYWTKGFEQVSYYDTDFARISTHTCGDLYAPFFDRALACKGVELILDPSQMWGPSGRVNETLLRARSIDNAVWLACSHWNSSDASLRSVIVDPYGQVMASSRHQHEGIISYDVDFDDRRVYYEGKRADQPTRGKTDIPSYFSEDMPEQKPGWRNMIFSHRRPELYGIIPTTNDVIMKYRPERSPF